MITSIQAHGGIPGKRFRNDSATIPGTTIPGNDSGDDSGDSILNT